MAVDGPFDVIQHQVPVFTARQYPHAILDERKNLYVAVKQYVPKIKVSISSATKSSDPITIIAAGGLGFIKELYESLFAEVFARARNAGVTVASVWIADMFNCGQSAVLNKDNLGCDPAWFDHARDLFTVITHFRDQMTQPIYGLGHSMGCNQLVYLSHWQPSLFQGLVCVESGCDKEYGKGIIFPWMMLHLKRKVDFDSREEAAKDLVRAHQAKVWDAQAKNNLMKYGVYEESGKWRATTPKEQIAALVCRFNPKRLGIDGVEDMAIEARERIPDVDPEAWNPGQFYQSALKQSWDLLPHVRPWVLYINGEKSPFFGRPKTRDERAKITGTGVGGSGGMRMGAVEQVVIKDGEHTMVFEKQVGEIADYIARWLGKETERWELGEKKRLVEWQANSTAEKKSVPKGYEKALAAQLKADRKPKL